MYIGRSNAPVYDAINVISNMDRISVTETLNLPYRYVLYEPTRIHDEQNLDRWNSVSVQNRIWKGGGQYLSRIESGQVELSSCPKQEWTGTEFSALYLILCRGGGDFFYIFMEFR